MTDFSPSRNVAYARVWTAAATPVLPADLAENLYGRGFMPGFTDPEGKNAPLMEAGLAEAVFAVGSDGYRVVNLTSSRGEGCRVSVHPSEAGDLPDDYLARRTVPRPRLCYIVTAGGPAHSDRNLCENIAEALMLMTNGLTEIGGLGMKGNRPTLHNSSWVGSIKTVS
ncbi:MAG: hypothetical protein SFU56_21310 [Capsulimonadales bacterium]|nr:hypothetical protein [Capsulimonadales bacterium]